MGLVLVCKVPISRLQFLLPAVEEDTTFEFTLTVTDDEGAESEDGAEYS